MDMGAVVAWGGAAAAAASGVVAAAACRFLVPLVAALARSGGALRPNYRGAMLPVGIGAVPAVAALTAFTLAAGVGAVPPAAALAASFPALAMALAGAIDDAWGDRSVRGLRGHVRAALAGRWTTGALKALTGMAAGLVGGVLVSPHSVTGALLAAGLIAGSANGVNLLDLRPGRAWKLLVAAWLSLAAVRLLTGAWAGIGADPDPAFVLGAASLGALAVYGPWDLRGQVMMGDAGANSLGALLGVGMALGLPPGSQAAALVGWAALHVVAEKSSLSAVIERVPLLRRVDAWGRPKA